MPDSMHVKALQRAEFFFWLVNKQISWINLNQCIFFMRWLRETAGSLLDQYRQHPEATSCSGSPRSPSTHLSQEAETRIMESINKRMDEFEEKVILRIVQLQQQVQSRL